MSVATSEQFVAVPGGRLYVPRWRPAHPDSDIPIVLLHDSLGCVATWRDSPALLAGRLGRAVLAYDRLGFGRSSQRDGVPSVRFVSEEAEIYFPALRR